MTDTIIAYLADLTGSGLEIESLANQLTDADNTLPTEIITAYLPVIPGKHEQQAAAEKIGEIQQVLANIWHYFPSCPEPKLNTETILEEDWGRKWKSFFTSFQITESLIIKPSWENNSELKETEATGNFFIEMDPGLAFGTGHHASTQLALLLLEELILKQRMQPRAILDVGTGSGILAMACVLFGAEKGLAIDNDPDAVETARQNIANNNLEKRITVSSEDITSLHGSFDIVVANITHDVLVDLSTDLVSRINPHGFLVLSGILKGDQEQSIRETYSEKGLQSIKSLTRDEWAALLFEKR